MLALFPLDVVLFPEKSSNVTDRPSLTLAVLAPDQPGHWSTLLLAEAGKVFVVWDR